MKVYTSLAAVLIGLCYVLTFKEAQAEFVEIGLKKYYIEREIRLNWFAAWNYCAVNQMNLFSVSTELESRFIRNYLKTTGYLPFWTSGNELTVQNNNNNPQRHFVWANTGIPLTFTDWYKNEPKKDTGIERCIAAAKDFQWVDSNCRALYFFICEQ